MGLGLGFLGNLVDPTNEYKSETHKIFSQCLVWVITVLVGNVTTGAFVILGLIGLGWILSLYTGAMSTYWWTTVFFGIWSLVEIVFYFYCKILRQKLDNAMVFPSLNSTEKEYFLDRVLAQCQDPWSTLVRWFHVHPAEHIGVECMEAWLSWAFFGKLHHDLNQGECQELAILTEKVVSRCPRIGRPSAKLPLTFMRLHFDEIVVQHKPFVAYAVISGMQVLGSLFLSHLGFVHHKLSGNSKLSYWTYGTEYLEDTKGTVAKEPIFIVHGIGIGIAMYFKLVQAVVLQDPERPVFILELPNISLKVIDRIPTFEETLEAVDEIFYRYNVQNCSWLSHSYGTIVTTWIIKERPKFVKKITFVDPVCFALWEPDLIYNFLYKRPPSPIHRLCQFFVAQDLVVASTLFRNFSWLRNILFPEDIHCPAQVFISSHDFIIDPESIFYYLQRYNDQLDKNLSESNRIGVNKMYGLAHGSILNSSSHIANVITHI